MPRKILFETLIETDMIPRAVAATPSGNVFVAAENEKIEQFIKDEDESMLVPVGATPSDNVYVVTDGEKIGKYQIIEEDNTLIEIEPHELGNFEVELAPEIMEAIERGSINTLFGNEPSYSSVMKIDMKAPISNRLADPRGIAINSGDQIYVSDHTCGRILKYDPTGQLVSILEHPPGSNWYLSRPRGIAVDSQDNLFVCDWNKAEVQWWYRNDTFVKAIAQGVWAMDVAIDQSDNLWVVDLKLHRVLKYERNGRQLASIGSSDGRPSKVDGEFLFPQGIAIDRSNHVHVCDMSSRVQELDSTGKHIQSYGLVQGAEGIAEEESRIYIIERKMRHIKVYNSI